MRRIDLYGGRIDRRRHDADRLGIRSVPDVPDVPDVPRAAADGLVTVTEALPVAAMSAALIWAMSSVAET